MIGGFSQGGLISQISLTHFDLHEILSPIDKIFQLIKGNDVMYCSALLLYGYSLKILVLYLLLYNKI